MAPAPRSPREVLLRELRPVAYRFREGVEAKQRPEGSLADQERPRVRRGDGEKPRACAARPPYGESGSRGRGRGCWLTVVDFEPESCTPRCSGESLCRAGVMVAQGLC